MDNRYLVKRALAYVLRRTERWPTMKRLLSLLIFKHDHNRLEVRGANNVVSHEGAALEHVVILIEGDNNVIEIGGGSFVYNSTITMKGAGHRLVLGERCAFNRMSFAFEDTDCCILIGADNLGEGASLSAAEPGAQIVIGEDGMLSPGADIRTTDSHSIIDVETGERLNMAENVTIGRHVWICAESRILKGARIGEHSIIGVRSVVNREIRDHAIAIGAPARVTRTGVTWRRERLPKHAAFQSSSGLMAEMPLEAPPVSSAGTPIFNAANT